MMRLSLSLLIGSVLIDVSTAVICNREDGECRDGDTCSKGLECIHGECQPDGSCLCHPCFSGHTCNEYVDKNYPYFLKKEETIYIEPSHRGLVYEARARDDDNYKTCLPESTQPCPCGEIAYEFMPHSMEQNEKEEKMFTIDKSRGDLRLTESAKIHPGDTFKVDVITSNHKDNSPFDDGVMSLDVLTLNIKVKETNSVDDYLMRSEQFEVDKDMLKYLKEEEEIENMKLQNLDIGVEPLHREKRSAVGTTLESTNFTLTLTNTVTEPMTAGSTADFTMNVILPTLPTTGNGTDLLVDIFVMDAISGVTTLALCGVTVTAIGSGISGITLATANQNIDRKLNLANLKFYDRAVIDFGTVFNSATTGTTDYTDSTIVIQFSASMITNPNFSNATAIVTAGAEYDNENYVMVAQAEFNISQSGTLLNATEITVEGPDSIKQFAGGTFDIHAFLVIPYDTIEVEVFTVNEVHDVFSIESLMVSSKGSNHDCVVGEDTYDFHESVTGRTNTKATANFPVLVKYIDYTNIAAAKTDVKNKIDLSFSIFVFDAVVSDVISIGAGISVGTTIIWTALINVTVLAGTIPPTTVSPTSLTAYAVDTSTANPEVNQYMTATWALHAGIPAAGSVLISCTATPGANSKICGVVYGKSGKYVSVFPDLPENTIYNADGSATWSFITNTSAIGASQTRNASEDFIAMEVTVVYLTNAAPAAATVTCTGPAAVTLTAALGTAGVDDMSGVTVKLSGSSFYYPSQAAVLATLTFPGGGAGYGTAILEASGDFFVSAWSAKVCKVDVLSIGRQAACAAKADSAMESRMTLKKIANDSLYDNAVEIDLGEFCGSKRDEAVSTDPQALFRVIFDIPKVQTVTATSYNISLGLLLNTNLVWTGWQNFTSSIAVPTTITGKEPILTIVPPSVITEEIYKPIVIKAYIKSHKSVTGAYKVTATSANSAILQVCKIIIMNIGKSYGCIDMEPYGKQSDPTQKVTVISDSTLVLSTVLDLGVVTNVGYGDFDPSEIADEDSIDVAIVVRGIAAGASSVTVKIDDTSSVVTTKSLVTNLTFTADSLMSANSIFMNVTSLDGTSDFYADVMKQMVVELHVPAAPPYDKPVKLEIINANATILTLCYAAVAWAGKNVPCLMPGTIMNVTTVGAAGEDIITLDFLSICSYPFSSNLTESIVKVYIGLMPAIGQTSSTITLNLYESGAVTTTQPVTITLAASAYVPANITDYGLTLYAVQNETVTSVEPGQRLWLGMYVNVPKFLTFPATLSVMTESEVGRAYATVHGFRWGLTSGTNVQCIAPSTMYAPPTFLQNATIDNITMIHTSQTDVMTVDLKYITNTGISYMQYISKPEDDLMMVEADILIADHDLLLNGGLITISFALKVGTTVYVLEKNLTLVRPPTNNVMVLDSELLFTDPAFNTTIPLDPFDKLNLTARIRHVLNESHIEAYDAVVRILLPSYIKFANATYMPAAVEDTYNCNITCNLTATDYLDFDIDYLFFTDNLEINFTVTVDPDVQMPKGLGLLSSTALFRFVGKEAKSTNPLKYLGTTQYVNYLVNGAECFEDLNVTTFGTCQFVASTAINAAVDAPNAITATGWSPAVRDTAVWGHYIIIDFLRVARLTKIVFTAVTGKRGVGTYKLQESPDGNSFLDITTCTGPISASPSVIPAECRFKSRYAKLTILTANDPDETKAIGVSFLWYGCYIGAAPVPANTCSLTQVTALTDAAGKWRQIAYDTANSIIYFCDDNPKKKRMVCYSSADLGTTWNPLPSYIGSLAGFEATTAKMYAWDTKLSARVASADGVNWSLVDSTLAASLSYTAPSSIPGNPQATFTNVVLGAWTADFTGLQTGGVYKVKWGSCCV